MSGYDSLFIRGAAPVLALGLVTAAAPASGKNTLDLLANETPIHAPANPQAIALLPKDYRFIQPGSLTVAIQTLSSPPLSLLASDNKTRIGSDPDIARLLADSLGLRLNLIPASWEDWPLGITAGKYDVALFNIAVTEPRKEKFDFASYRVDPLGFLVSVNSPIQRISEPKDIAGLRVIVGSGTNQERILLKWDAENRAAGRAPVTPIYLTDDASASLYLQAGRADVQFGPHSALAYKSALTGKTRLVGTSPYRAWVATTTKKGNDLAPALQAAINGVIADGQYQKVLARWGESGEAISASQLNPPGISY